MGNEVVRLCNLSDPATCEYKVAGKLYTIVALCDGNSFWDTVKNCPYRRLASIAEADHNKTNTETGDPDLGRALNGG